ncbi:DNA internalization-related competence protein ComEC/Rec2 [Glaesserella sp.]|uniref:DNA internalization-related competence protein ComEC/Rec2 n=1 Tax=Glaesserella sp. TaxID=2094731 RepID=UPI00359FC808
MNLDRFCQYFVLLLLPILWLPQAWLSWGMMIAMLICLWSLFCRSLLLGGLGLILAMSYGQIVDIAERANRVKAENVTEMILIRQILRQQDYQTAIAQRENGEQIYLIWQSEQPLILHEKYRAELNLRPISGRLNHGNFDRQKWLFAQDIRQTGSVKKVERIAQNAGKPIRTAWLYRVKQQTEKLPSQGLLLALAFGERAWMSQQDWQVFQQTTTAHLIAISGLHIGLTFVFGFGLARAVYWLGLRFSLLQAVGSGYFFAKIIGWLSAFGYCFLAGFAIPTVRTLIAISLVLCCRFFRRHYTPWQLWWRGVALLLLLDPLALLSGSFWLSVLAVASLIFWYQCFPFYQWQSLFFCKKFGKTYRLFASLLHLQIGIWLVFSPVQFLFFDGSSVLALPANLLIVPLYSFILVPLILFSLVTDNLWSTWQLADWVGQGSLALLTPMASYWFPLSYTQQWLFISLNLLLLLLLYVWLNPSPKRYRVYAVVVVLLFNRAYALPKWIFPEPQVQWINFDVGQGLAMALIFQTSGRKQAIIYDSGASWSDGSMAETEILPYLRRQGIEVEAIIISHDDNDHAGGLKALTAEYPQAKVILSGKNNAIQTVFEPCVAGQQWQFGAVKMEAVYPLTIAERAKNEDSCVLLVKIGQYKILWTGDSGIEQERYYAQQIGKINFLQVGHHGSRSSTSQTLLAHTQPDVAIISAGRWNPWKHPNQQVVERLAHYRTTVLNTAKVGMIKVDFFSQRYDIDTARSRWSPWYSSYLGE